MLEHITIKDFVIVESLQLDVDAGLTVLTGETGAGKSILLDALAFVLGDRADSGTIRHGAERADVSVQFSVETIPEALAWLKERELDAETECLLRRTLGQDGRSRGYINSNNVPVQMLRELGDLLVDIHGQNVHQSLLKTTVQRQTLDAYAGNEKLCASVAELYIKWMQAQNAYETLSATLAERDARLQLLRYQVQELQTLDLHEGESEALDKEHARLANANNLLQTCEQALQTLYESDDAALTTVLDRVLSDIELLMHIDGALAPTLELLTNASIQLQEAARALRAYRDNLDLDPERLQQIDERIGAIHNLSRKHRVSGTELPQLTQRLTTELDQLENAEAHIDALKADVERTALEYRETATKLSAARKKAAKKLSQEVTRQMQDLGMKGGVFEIAVAALANDHFNHNGVDRVEFMVSANAGQPPRALNKVASGGELSRISLAIEVVTAQTTGIPTLVFDEVDSGVGGGVAEIVGKLLRRLAKHRQVLCVTHLPQVAAQGENHWAVHKRARNGDTKTAIEILTGNDRVDEVARMLGGMKITQQTLAHAKEMLQHAQSSN